MASDALVQQAKDTALEMSADETTWNHPTIALLESLAAELEKCRGERLKRVVALADAWEQQGDAKCQGNAWEATEGGQQIACARELHTALNAETPAEPPAPEGSGSSQ